MGMNMKQPSPFRRELDYTLGLDLGQSIDPSAIAIVERYLYADEPAVYSVRHLERLPLGMDYPAQVAYIGELLRREPLSNEKTQLIIDHSGVGRPVFDIFVKAGLRPRGLVITAGQDAKRTDTGWSVSKLQLISRLQAELHQGRLRISDKLTDAPALLRDLQDFRVSFSSTGNAIFGARVGKHDDLVLALAIAVWQSTQGANRMKVRRVIGF